MIGSIYLHRQITNNPIWFSEPFTKAQAWIDILLITNYERSMFLVRGNEVHVERGQFAYAEETLAKRWKWSRNKVRRFLEQLKINRQIERKTIQQNSRLLSIYTVLNYDKYQTNETTDDTTERQQKVQIKEHTQYKGKFFANEREKSVCDTPESITDSFMLSLAEEFSISLEEVKRAKIKMVTRDTSKGERVANYPARLKYWITTDIEKQRIKPNKTISQIAKDEGLEVI